MTSASEVQQLVLLIDRLERLRERAALSELEVEAGGLTLVLRSPAAIGRGGPGAAVDELVAGAPDGRGAVPGADEAVPERAAHAVTAPLTGVFYRSPSPGAEPYVREGGPVSAGQVIGLIEAMKLFNEIKSDVTGTVRRVTAGDGDLVKARQALIEVDPS